MSARPGRFQAAPSAGLVGGLLPRLGRRVAVEVGAGTLALGLTDTDDALAELRAKRPVRMAYLDAGSGETGILVLPNVVARVRGGPHPTTAARLIDFLLSPAVEGQLAAGESGQIPLHPSGKSPAVLNLPPKAKRMKVDFARAAELWDEAMAFVRDEFSGP